VTQIAVCGGGRRHGRGVGGRARGRRHGRRHPAGRRASTANADPTIRIQTNLGEARNAVIVWSADAVIAVGGFWGTLSEVALARSRRGIRVVQLGGWQAPRRSGLRQPTHERRSQRDGLTPASLPEK
jgi:hypothetical protein